MGGFCLAPPASLGSFDSGCLPPAEPPLVLLEVPRLHVRCLDRYQSMLCHALVQRLEGSMDSRCNAVLVAPRPHHPRAPPAVCLPFPQARANERKREKRAENRLLKEKEALAK